MSTRSWQDRVRDILDAITEIQDFVRGFDYSSFEKDRKTIKAVELNFIVIGEAATHISPEIQTANPHVPWNLMRAMLNRLVHVYFSGDPKIVWDTIHQDLPPLQDPLSQLLADKG